MMKRIYFIPLFAFLASILFAQDITLAKPPAKLGIDVLEAIRERSAARTFVKKDIPITDLSTIVWAGNGLKGTTDAVSAASKAGATIPVSGDVDYIDLYVLSAKGAWRYDQAANVLKSVGSKDVRAQVTQEAIPTAALMILFAVDNAKAPSFLKGMPALFQQMANGTAGYGAQNIALVAAGLKIDSIVMYNIKPDATAAALKLPKEVTPLFIMQLGYTQ
jgi:nitroreductase